MANYDSFSDIIDQALDAIGEKTDGTSDYNSAALVFLNRVYRQVWMGGMEVSPELHEDWWWLRKYPPGSLVLEIAIETGTVAVTQDSTTVTFSSAPTKSVANWHLKIKGEPDLHRVSTHTANVATATLKDAWTGATNAAASYTLMKLEYDLGPTDVLRVISPLRVFRNQFGERHDGEIEGIDAESMDLRFPLKYVESGIPTYFAVIYETDNKMTVRFNRYVKDRTRVEFDYLFIPDAATDTSTEPVLPLQWRHVLSDGVAWRLAIMKNDTIADVQGLLFKGGVQAMASENKRKMTTTERSFGWIYPNARDRTGEFRVKTTSGLVLIP